MQKAGFLMTRLICYECIYALTLNKNVFIKEIGFKLATYIYWQSSNAFMLTYIYWQSSNAFIKIWTQGVFCSFCGALNIYKKHSNMSRVVRKQAFCICENKKADQLRGNREADQHLCFRYMNSTIPLLFKSEI